MLDLVGMTDPIALGFGLMGVHRVLRPDNVLFDPGTGVLKLIGFGMAARLSGVLVAPERPMVIEGSPAYMSPEQTGHMNRGVDYRSDLEMGIELGRFQRDRGLGGQ
jgi:serine/threonine protein kinase